MSEDEPFNPVLDTLEGVFGTGFAVGGVSALGLWHFGKIVGFSPALSAAVIMVTIPLCCWKVSADRYPETDAERETA